MLDFSQNYFALFGLTPAFDLDVSDLMKRYRDIQSSIHPDRHAGGSEHEQRLAVQIASRVNEAFQCLKQPLTRARYLLEQAGHPLVEDGRTHQDPGFLIEQIELREALERAAGKPAALASLQKQIAQKILLMQQAFGESFSAGQHERSADIVAKWQFLVKLQADAERLDEQGYGN